MHQNDGGGTMVWRGWHQIEKETELSANTLRKLADRSGLPLFKLGGETCLTPSGWANFVRRLAGESK